MAGISAKQVKELRDSTGAGMMDCKKAFKNRTVICRRLSSGYVKRASPQRQRKKGESLQKAWLKATFTQAVASEYLSKSIVKLTLWLVVKNLRH